MLYLKNLRGHIYFTISDTDIEAAHISRWDSERELFLQRHRTRTTKYNILHHFQVMADH